MRTLHWLSTLPAQAQPGRQLPVEEMSHLVAAVRRATRVLWALHVTLQEVGAFRQTPCLSSWTKREVRAVVL